MKSKCKVLIVGDNRDLLPALELLSDETLEILVADNGLAALSLLEADGDIDAVLLDLVMPTFDGIACVEEIRRNEELYPRKKSPRLAFFTALTVDSVIHRVQIENNVERIFTKPIDPYRLIEEIKLWLPTVNFSVTKSVSKI